jgi:hypothetical protein
MSYDISYWVEQEAARLNLELENLKPHLKTFVEKNLQIIIDKLGLKGALFEVLSDGGSYIVIYPYSSELKVKACELFYQKMISKDTLVLINKYNDGFEVSVGECE